jgi:hypothetical protein
MSFVEWRKRAPRVAGSVVDFWQDKLHVCASRSGPRSQSALNSCDALTPHKANCPAKSSPGLAQIAVSTCSLQDHPQPNSDCGALSIRH